MHLETMIDIIIEKGKVEDMHRLKKLTVKAVHKTKELGDEDFYQYSEKCLHEMAYGDYLTEEQVKCATAKFMNKDGTKGEHWDYDTVMSVYKSKSMTCNFPTFYYAINYVYCKHYQPPFTTDNYIELAKDIMPHIVSIYYANR